MTPPPTASASSIHPLASGIQTRETLAEHYERLVRETQHRRLVDLELRGLDIVLSLLLLALAIPLSLLIAGAVLATSGRPVFYRGRRVGRAGRVFTMTKFRTLRAGAESRLGHHLGTALVEQTESEVTRIGARLRSTQLDEVPQLWNVLKGDMSLVGPRPPIPEEVELYHRWHRRRLSMKPGLTCLWQVSGRNNVDFDRWMELDLQYIDNWSHKLDFDILWKTVPAVLRGRGA